MRSSGSTSAGASGCASAALSSRSPIVVTLIRADRSDWLTPGSRSGEGIEILAHVGAVEAVEQRRAQLAQPWRSHMPLLRGIILERFHHGIAARLAQLEEFVVERVGLVRAHLLRELAAQANVFGFAPFFHRHARDERMLGRHALPSSTAGMLAPAVIGRN